jgi:mRNA-degrading endonuclease toxin of MazEF toxin-antitoxin module
MAGWDNFDLAMAANLRQASVVNVTQIQTIDRARLEDRIGTLTRTRLREIWRGVLLVVEVNGPA